MDTGKRDSALKRELGLFDSTMIVIGVMIGSGIFIVSADMARTLGSPGYLLLAWAVTGLVTIAAGLSYGELAGMMPQAGGQYVYLREAYNPLVGFLFGWTQFMVIQTGSIAAVGVAFAKFTAVFIPAVGEDTVALSVAGHDISGAQVLAIGSIAALTWFNIRGLRTGKLIQDIFTITKTAALAGLIVAGLAWGAGAFAIDVNFSDLWNASWVRTAADGTTASEPLTGFSIVTAIGVAMVGSLFAADAWNNITFTAGEISNPKRNIPLSLALGTTAVIVLYLLVNLVYLLTLPLKGTPDGADVIARGIQFAASDRVATAAAWTIFGHAAEFIMAGLIMVSTFGCNNGMILTGARVYYAMALDGLFFRKTGTLNANSVPAFALVVQSVWACLLCLTGTYGDLLDYVMFAVLIFYVLTIAGIFILRRKRPDAERPYRAFGYPFVPALYILVVTGICVDLLVYKPAYTWPGLIIVVLGVPVYYGWKTWSRRRGDTGGTATRGGEE